MEDMDCSEEVFINYTEIAREYRKSNWAVPHSPFHKCFAAAEEKETKHSRSGPFKSLHINIPQSKTSDKIIMPKSASAKLTPEERAQILWDNF